MKVNHFTRLDTNKTYNINELKDFELPKRTVAAETDGNQLQFTKSIQKQLQEFKSSDEDESIILFFRCAHIKDENPSGISLHLERIKVIR